MRCWSELSLLACTRVVEMVRRVQSRWRARRMLLAKQSLNSVKSTSGKSAGRNLGAIMRILATPIVSRTTSKDKRSKWFQRWASLNQSEDFESSQGAPETSHQEFQEQGHATKLLRLLQLFCENHANELQGLLAYQQGSGQRSVNLVACVFNLLKELEVGVDRSDIELTTQCLETLTEFVQGQQSIENSKMLLRLKCHSVVDRLLTRDPHQLSGSTVRQVAHR